ncbi:MAG TPA: DUF1893 domain-containing protein [Syntrophales bacterium]|nr:DUF1893 domain-containing protein [Syntrophales bacterium]
MESRFRDYNLALFSGGRRIFTSMGKGLRPLLECLDACRGLRDCVLHDKIMGLAAARLAADSGIVREIVSRTASEPAARFLERRGLPLEVEETVPAILTLDGGAVCPGERIALAVEDPVRFEAEIRAMIASGSAGRPAGQ